MKHMKKLVAMLVSVLMGFAMMTTVFADDNTSTQSSSSDKPTTYTLTIDGAEGHKFRLYQIFTGDVSGEGDQKTLSNVKYGKDYPGKTNGDPVPENELAAISDAEAFANGLNLANDKGDAVKSTTISGLQAGYYVVRDVTDVTSESLNGKDISRVLVNIVGDTTMTVKSGTTTSEKKVKDKNESKGETSGWQDSADYAIGQAVPFKLEATVASDYDNYDKGYTLVFHDDQSTGLTFNSDSVKVFVDDQKITSGYVVDSKPGDGHTFDVKFINLKDIPSVKAGSNIRVEYTSTLNTSAVIGSVGNPNKSYISYTNNPYDEQHSDNGRTPEDKVIVFTYKVVVNKVKQDKKSPLPGAAFKLEKKLADGTYNVVKFITINDEKTTFTFTGLDDGEYKLTETKTPDGYNTITPIEFTISAEHDVDSADPKLTSLSGSATTGEATFTPKTDDGSLTTDVVNKKGSVLPHTGGIGTTIFYVAGSLMVVVAGVLLAAKKKAEAK